MKICNTCNEERNDSDFYKGHAKCKPCYILKVKAHREEKADYYREYDNNRANLPHRVEARKAYTKTEAGKISAGKGKAKWVDSNIVKRYAHIIVGNAVARGELLKPDKCDKCSKSGRLNGHHDDYSQPLVVRWLCSKCHCEWHKEHGEGINA